MERNPAPGARCPAHARGFLDRPWGTPPRYLSNNEDPEVQRRCCSRLAKLAPARLEPYLLQFVYLAAERPASPLEQLLIDLCALSFRVAVKV